MRAAVRSLIVLIFLLLGCGSDTELIGGLSSAQSVEVVVVLSRAGIPAKREKSTSGASPRYRILVQSNSHGKAFELLHEFRLLSDVSDTFENFTAPKGFAPNSREVSNLRLDYALALRIERLIKALPGVVEVKALVSSHLTTNRRETRNQKVAGASVVVRYFSSSGRPEFTVDEVRTIVTQAVPGLGKEQVNLQLTKVELPGNREVFTNTGSGGSGDLVAVDKINPFGFRIPREDKSIAVRAILGVLLTSCAAGCIIGMFLGAWNTKRKIAKLHRRATAEGGKSFFLEASFGADDPRASDRLLTSGPKSPGRPGNSGGK